MTARRGVLLATAAIVVSCGGARQDDPPDAPPTPAVDASVVVHIDNRSGHDVSVAVDDQQTPLWIEIDDPPIALNGYGLPWCDDRHVRYEPVVHMQPLAAGAGTEVALSCAQVVAAGDCWTTVPMPTGKHRARVCAYEGLPALVTTGDDPTSGAPSAWLTPRPSRCVEFTIDVVSDTITRANVDL
jgi:hypothetical protein